ncbi:MAG: amidohydrolase family protein, partial [Flavobacterium sp.]
LAPMQIIQSASETAASCMGLKKVGALRAGNWADFIVLDANPLADMKNSRSINAVFVSGVEVAGSKQ